MKAHKRIRKYREDNNIPAKAFAKSLGVAESTLRSIENGNRPVTPEMSLEIERVTGIPRIEFHPKLFGELAA